jgi:cellulose synthase/poly-beta-1,6-N-acetylglucosamine synthase-like glycosyltransferase
MVDTISMLMIWVLSAAVLAILYPYAIFPALLGVIRRRTANVPAEPVPPLPRVAVLVSAFIEAERIADKIGNFQSFDYPEDRITLWIGTDGSPDDTAEVVRRINAPRVHLVERKERSGKTAVLNDLASRAEAEIFIFSDVNAAYRPDTVKRLVRHFADPKVGVVCGRTIIRGRDGQAMVEGAYYRFESWLKVRESANGWLAGAIGAVYSIRADLYRALPPQIINDLAHPCQVSAMGYECRFDPTAISEEDAGDDAGREFSRQTRMTAQAAYVLAKYTPQLLRSGRLGMLWILLSHKWLRWTAGIWIIAAVCVLPFLSPVLTAVAVGGGALLL